jgi:transposase-like protein
VAPMSAIKGQRSEYTPTEIETALRVVAFYGGNTERASREIGINARTLRVWRGDAHRDRYQEIVAQEGPKLEAIAADQAREAILRSSDVEHRIFDLLDAATDPEHEAFKPKDITDLAGALQRITTSKGINTTKLLELTGRPTQVVQHLSPQEAIRGLARDLGTKRA